MRRGQGFEFLFHFEEKHEPVALTLVTMFTDESRQVQIGGPQAPPKFFTRFPAGTGVRRFAGVGVKFSTAGTPQPEVGFLRSFQQQNLIALIETIEQRGDFVGQSHCSLVCGQEQKGGKRIQGCKRSLILRQPSAISWRLNL
jgi:hypothetical protein